MAGFWKRLFGGAEEPGAPTTPEPSHPPRDDSDVLEEVRDHIRGEVAAGFDDPEAIATGALEMFVDDMDAATLEVEVPSILAEEMTRHKAEQDRWPESTDCDRLDAAFAALETKGVIARHHFTCCGTCGSTEIWDEIAAAEKAGITPRGYAFYHWQDTEHAVDGYGLMLNYGACVEGEAAALDVAGEIVRELEKHGLRTDWDGSWDRRIGVPMDWKRRRAA